jgi:hypothetical protein
MERFLVLLVLCIVGFLVSEQWHSTGHRAEGIRLVRSDIVFMDGEKMVQYVYQCPGQAGFKSVYGDMKTVDPDFEC